MKKLIVFFSFFLLLNSLNAQSDLTFIQVDTATYRAYLNSDWNRIIKIGELAVDQQIDYYYLRVRMAYAYYMKKRYRQAIPHYKQALEFSHNDAIASEHLYYCYQYSGRSNDALKLKSHFPSTLRKFIDKGEPKIFTEVGIYFGLGTGLSDQFKEELMQTAPTGIDGSQIMPNKSFNLAVSLNHQMGSSILARHHLNVLYRDGYALEVVDTTSYLSESQTLRQYNYHLAIDVTPFYGFTFTPAISFINYRVPIVYDYTASSGNDRKVYTYDTFNEAALALKVKKQLGIVEVGLAVAHSNFNLSTQNNMGLLVSLFPFGNLNFYYTGALYKHVQQQNANSETQNIQSHKIGLKVHKNLWLEGLWMHGGFTNFYDPFSELTYNSLEKFNSIYGVNLIFPLYKSGSTLYIGYRNYHSETMFVPDDDVFNTSNNKSMKYQSITGGIIWKF